MVGESGDEGDETLQRDDDGFDAEIEAQLDPKVEGFVQFLRLGFDDVFVVTLTNRIDVRLVENRGRRRWQHLKGGGEGKE